MAPIIPDPTKIRSFRSAAAFEEWLAANHARETELWLKIHKKDSNLPQEGQEHLEPGQPAIDKNPKARGKFKTLGRMNLFALAFRTNNMKTPAGRAKKIATLVAMLAPGETIVPERPK